MRPERRGLTAYFFFFVGFFEEVVALAGVVVAFFLGSSTFTGSTLRSWSSAFSRSRSRTFSSSAAWVFARSFTFVSSAVERSLSFERVVDLDWETAVAVEDDRKDYGERRLRVMARLARISHAID